MAIATAAIPLQGGKRHSLRRLPPQPLCSAPGLNRHSVRRQPLPAVRWLSQQPRIRSRAEESMLCDSCRRQRRRYSAPGRNVRSLRRLPPLATTSAGATHFRWFTSDFFTLPYAAITFPRARQPDAKTPAQISNPQWKSNKARRLTPQAARRLSPQQLFCHRTE